MITAVFFATDAHRQQIHSIVGIGEYGNLGEAEEHAREMSKEMEYVIAFVPFCKSEFEHIEQTQGDSWEEAINDAFESMICSLYRTINGQ